MTVPVSAETAAAFDGEKADRALAVFDVPPYNEDDLAGNLQDLLTDLLHLAAREELDFDRILVVARVNYEVEAAEAAAEDAAAPIDLADVDADLSADPHDYLGYCLVCHHPVLACAGGETRCKRGVAHDEACVTEHAQACPECLADDRAKLIAALREVDTDLSPENLAGDGLNRAADIQSREIALRRRRQSIITQLGGEPPQAEVWPELYQ